MIESRSGEELLKIQEKKLTVRDKMEIERDGHTVATVKKALIGIRDRYSIEVEGGDDLSAKGNFVDHEFEIERDGHKVAEVSKRWLRVRDAYGIEVAPDEDDALILAIDRLHRPDGPRLSRATPRTRGRLTSAGACSIGCAGAARTSGRSGRPAAPREPVGEDREADGDVDRERDQALVREPRLLDHDHREDDRGEAARAEPAEEGDRRRRGRRSPSIAIATGTIRTSVRLSTA